jgi:TolA-binding protein
MQQALADTMLASLECSGLGSSAIFVAEAGEDIYAVCDSLLGLRMEPETRFRLRYARALFVPDSARCDSLLGLAGEVTDPGLRQRCIGACLATAGTTDQAGLDDLMAHVNRLFEVVHPEERVALARFLVGRGLGSEGAVRLEPMVEELEPGYDDEALLDLGLLLKRAGARGRALEVLGGEAAAPAPSHHSLAAAREVFILEHTPPEELDIATEVERAADRGAGPEDLGDLFLEDLGDFDRAVTYYRRAVEELPEGESPSRLRLKLIRALALKGLETGEHDWTGEAVDLVASAGADSTFAPKELLAALEIATSWWSREKDEATRIIRDISVRPDITGDDLYRCACGLFHIFRSSPQDANLYAECVVVLDRLIHEYTSAPRARNGALLLGRTRLLVNDFAGALEAFELARATWRDPGVERYAARGMGECYLRSGGLREAVSHFKESRLESPAVAWSVGRTYESLDEPDSAVVYFRKGLLRYAHPDLAGRLKLHLALALGEMGDAEGAAEIFDSPVPSIRERLAAERRLIRALEFTRRGYHGLARLAGEEILGGMPASCEAALLGEALGLDEVPDPLDRDGVSCDPHAEYDLLRRRAGTACLQGPQAGCIEARRAFTTRYPLDARTKLDLELAELTARMAEGDSTRASLEGLDERYRERPRFAELIYADGLRIFKAKEFRRAIPRFMAIVMRYPESPLYHGACFKLGTSYFMTEDYDSSAVYFRLATHSRDVSEVVNALFNLGLALEENGELSPAARTFHELAVRFPFSERFERALMRAAYNYERTGRGEKAVDVYRGLMEHAADTTTRAEARYWMAETLAEMGRPLDAAVEFLRVGHLHPGEAAWAGTAAFRAGMECEDAGLADHALSIYRMTVRRYGAGSEWGRAAAERVETLAYRPAPQTEED